ncbi:MAG: hypothetical protein HRT86_17290 [Ilumatobacteraceae bacterium]|nr:hypothetical protein [Ilumatobacteraceae bacterium]
MAPPGSAASISSAVHGADSVGVAAVVLGAAAVLGAAVVLGAAQLADPPPSVVVDVLSTYPSR